MNPSYVRVRVPKVEALRRFATWQGLAEAGPLARATASEATELACDDLGQWKGQAILVSEVADWSLFADLTGGYNWKPRFVAPVDRELVLTVELQAPVPAAVPRPGAWLGDLLEAMGFAV